MARLRIYGKLAFVKGIKEATHIGLKEAKDICDEIVKDDVAEFDPKKFGWNEQTLKEIVSIANMYGTNVIIFSYE